VGLSALAAAVPIFTLLYLLAAKRTPAWKAVLLGLGAACVIALAVQRMPLGLALSAIGCGAAFGLPNHVALTEGQAQEVRGKRGLPPGATFTCLQGLVKRAPSWTKLLAASA